MPDSVEIPAALYARYGQAGNSWAIAYLIRPCPFTGTCVKTGTSIIARTLYPDHPGRRCHEYTKICFQACRSTTARRCSVTPTPQDPASGRGPRPAGDRLDGPDLPYPAHRYHRVQRAAPERRRPPGPSPCHVRHAATGTRGGRAAVARTTHGGSRRRNPYRDSPGYPRC